MNHIRGLAVWLGALLLASALCTTVWELSAGGSMANWRAMAGIGLAALIFTIAGSTFLTLLFAGMGARPIVQRYFIPVLVGGTVGAAIMLVLGTTIGTTARDDLRCCDQLFLGRPASNDLRVTMRSDIGCSPHPAVGYLTDILKRGGGW